MLRAGAVYAVVDVVVVDASFGTVTFAVVVVAGTVVVGAAATTWRSVVGVVTTTDTGAFVGVLLHPAPASSATATTAALTHDLFIPPPHKGLPEADDPVRV